MDKSNRIENVVSFELDLNLLYRVFGVGSPLLLRLLKN